MRTVHVRFNAVKFGTFGKILGQSRARGSVPGASMRLNVFIIVNLRDIDGQRVYDSPGYCHLPRAYALS